MTSWADWVMRTIGCTPALSPGFSFQSVVVFGMRTDAYEVTDTGMMRTYDGLTKKEPWRMCFSSAASTH